jgi:hypothetical protein
MQLKLPLKIGFDAAVKAIKNTTVSIPIILSTPISYAGSSMITNTATTTIAKLNSSLLSIGPIWVLSNG